MFSYYHGHAYLIVFVSGHVIVATERQARGAQHPFVVMYLAAYWLALLTAVRVTRRNAECGMRNSNFLGMLTLRLLAPARMLLRTVCAA